MKKPAPEFRVLCLTGIIAVLTLLVLPQARSEPDTNFFRISDSWNERFRYLGTKAAPASETQGFLKDTKTKPELSGASAKYFKEEEVADDLARFVPKTPAPQFVALSQFGGAHPSTLVVELDQVVALQTPQVQRYAVTVPDKLIFFRAPASDTLQMKGQNVGSTTLHVWDSIGRTSIPIRVIPQKQFVEYSRRAQENIEQSESFKLEYRQTRSAVYDGNSFEDLSRGPLSYSQDFSMRGDTPYGELSGYASIAEFDDQTDLSSATVSLTDGKIGKFRNFDLTAGNNQISTELMSMPAVSIRGLTVDYERPDHRQGFTTFYGRETGSALGTLLTDLSSANAGDRDSFVGGAIYDMTPFENAEWKMAHIQAYGQHRDDSLNHQSSELIQKYRFGRFYNAGTATAFDTQRFAQRAFGGADYERFSANAEYRDISKDFYAITGSPGAQGEQGLRLDFFTKPIDGLEARYATDIYRDRLFPLEGEEDRFNVRQDADAVYQLDDRSNLRADYRNSEETALLSPSRSDTVGLTYNRSFDILDRRVSAFVRLQHQDSESLTNSDINYRRQTLSQGFNTILFWDINLSLSQSNSILEEVELRNITFPQVTTYALNRSGRFADTPLSYDTQVRYTDEERTDSDRSFLVGEDRLEIYGELRYELSDMELYVNGRYSNIRGENRLNENSRAEAEVTTGVRYLFDTQVRWEPSAAFYGAVFNDANSDGIRQEGEAGIPGAVVYVGPQRITTGADGVFKTEPVFGKKADIGVDAASIPPGYAGSTPLRRSMQIREASEPIFFGVVGRAAILGYVFNDMNHNGRYDTADPGVEGVRVTLDGKDTQVTNIEGRFRFSGTTVGAHELTMDIKSLSLGYLPSGRLSQTADVYEGVDFRSDFPVRAKRMLAGRVFIDKDKSGRFGEGDEPVASAKIRLGSLSALSNIQGYYLIDDVEPGSYALSVETDAVAGAIAFRRDIVFTHEPKEADIEIPLELP